MDLDSRGYNKIYTDGNSVTAPHCEEYRRILLALHPLSFKYSHETPEMWCSRIRDPFRKILEENPNFLSKNRYIKMVGKFIYENTDYGHPSDYIYCSVCDSLVFTPINDREDHRYRDSHLKRCISGNTNSNEHARREEILKYIDRREFRIWKCKQDILREEVKIKRLQLELASQSLPHSEKDKLASVSYDYDLRLEGSYEAYVQAKASMAKNTTPNASNFEPACISPTRQETISPTSYQSSGVHKSKSAGELFVLSRYIKQNSLIHLNQPKGTVLRLGDGIKITIV